MKITIVKDDMLVGINSDRIVLQESDFSFLPNGWHALQWEGEEDGTNGSGEIEYLKTNTQPSRNVQIVNITDYMNLVNKAKTLIQEYYANLTANSSPV